MTPPPDFHIGKHRVTWTRVPDDDTVRFQAWTHVDGVYVRARCVPSKTNVEMFQDFALEVCSEADLDRIIAEFHQLTLTADDVREEA